MNIYLLLGNPDTDSFNNALADAYEKAAVAKGHDVRRQNLGNMKFDPILWKGYKEVQALEPDLLKAQENIMWCNHWVIIYPIWWGSMPAILKGFFDRTLYSGFAYKYHDNDPFWDKLLKGRSAHVITTCDAPNWWIWWQYRNSDLNSVKRATLEFCGIEPVKVTRFDNIRKLKKEQLAKYIQKIEREV